jgi:hypothetical protein
MMPNQGAATRSKLGILSIDQPLDSTHTMAGELASRTSICLSPMPPSERLSRGGNILRDSFRWPLSGRQGSFNRVRHDRPQRCRARDYQATEVRRTTTQHQSGPNRVSKYEISGSCVDNYHQADRLVRAARYEMREGNFFCTLSSTGLALLLEEAT